MPSTRVVVIGLAFVFFGAMSGCVQNDSVTTQSVETEPFIGKISIAPEEFRGTVLLLHWEADNHFAATTFMQGVLSSDPRWAEPLSPLGYLNSWDVETFLFYGEWFIPTLGNVLQIGLDQPEWDPASLSILDGGERILAGDDWQAYREDVDGLQFYESALEEENIAGVFTTGGTISFASDGGTDLPQTLVANSVGVPEIVQLTSDHDPEAMHLIAPDEDITVSWEVTATTTDTMLVTALGDNWGIVAHVDDSVGSYTFDEASLNNLGGDEIQIILGRLVESAVPVGDGKVLVRALTETWLNFRQVESLGFSPDVGVIGSTMTLTVYRRDDHFIQNETSLDLPGATVSQTKLSDDGHIATFSLSIGPEAPMGLVPVKITSGQETIVAGNDFMIYSELPENDVCEMAGLGPPLRDGEYFGWSQALSNAYMWSACDDPPFELDGRDAVYRIKLRQGEGFNLGVVADYADVSLALISDCSSACTPLIQADNAVEGGLELLSYTAPEDGNYYLVVDTGSDAPDDHFYLTYQFLPGAGLEIEPKRWVQGQIGWATVTNHNWPFEPDNLSMFFGEDIEVLQYDFDENHPNEFELQLSLDQDASSGYRVIEAYQDELFATSSISGFQISEWVSQSDACAPNDSIELAAGSWVTTMGQTLANQYEGTGCFDSPAIGEDLVYRIHLPNEGSGFVALIEADFDAVAYLRSDCESGTLPTECSDIASDSEPELIAFQAGAGEAGDWYLVIDSLSGGSGTVFLEVVQW